MCIILRPPPPGPVKDFVVAVHMSRHTLVCICGLDRSLYYDCFDSPWLHCPGPDDFWKEKNQKDGLVMANIIIVFMRNNTKAYMYYMRLCIWFNSFHSTSTHLGRCRILQCGSCMGWNVALPGLPVSGKRGSGILEPRLESYLERQKQRHGISSVHG
jgi:hypothetical protein